jgi:hypothetical protein
MEGMNENQTRIIISVAVIGVLALLFYCVIIPQITIALEHPVLPTVQDFIPAAIMVVIIGFFVNYLRSFKGVSS